MDETNNSTISSKTAIVVIHGMGNQYPMETITDFVDNLFKKEENKDNNPKSIYSAPERITGSFDQRKLIGFHNNVQYDCYEYYWAHLIKEPSVSDTISWMYKLIWKKEPSERLNKYISIIRMSSIGLLLLISIIIFFYYWLFTWIISCCPLWSHLFFFIVSVVAFYKLRNIFRLLTQSFGDVIRYTVPHPSNIEGRQKISNNAVEFLTNLHDKDYSRIVIVGHSLGSIIAYEMLINTFGHLNKLFKNVERIEEKDKEELLEVSREESFNKMQFMGWKWKVSDFITCGSPLCHAEMILTKNKDLFKNKKELGEYPVSEPIQDSRKLFYLNKKTKKYIPTHYSVFKYVEWNNIHFENDIIGGKLRALFGQDIHDHPPIKPKTFKRILASHTQYWNKKQEEKSFKIIEEIIKK